MGKTISGVSSPLKEMNIGPYQHVLDVACGTCVFTKEALRQEPTLTVEALDFNAEMLEQGRERMAHAGSVRPSELGPR